MNSQDNGRMETKIHTPFFIPKIYRKEYRMKKKTDLPKVRATARALLLTNIHETEFSPVIVSHPFTDSGFVAAPNTDGEIGLLNIAVNDADQRRWRDYMGKLIDKAKSAYEIYTMITKPYGLTFLKYTAPDLSQEDLSSQAHGQEPKPLTWM